ncbi:F0F1 ATP synthase subunit delta [Hoylesella enoeca]|uniref:ATP synthase subunit delta n=1 Tax=Hoylesella enoeca TaxID=76123 RepID=A0A0S2KJT2_9BACT|nr:F0F1 ATP synthase subunit delta [Hoylesella enoeca]ALO48528.1 ATP synthase F0F1 subunit delta [Hoylesella enoeca]
MDIGVISVRYARALLKGAIAERIESKVYQEMQILLNSFLTISELRFTIDNPMLSKDKKRDLLVAACGESISPITHKFLDLVLREGRENVLQFIAVSYITLYRKQKNITSGKLITATVVTPAIEQKLQQMVKNRTQGVVEFKTEVDPDLIGGFVLEYDTYRMDASVKSELNTILTQLRK